MFDIGFSEVFVIAIVALIVLGPERLPKAARFAGLWVRRARAQWYSVKSELENELADEELKRSLRQAQADLRDAQAQLRDSGQIMREGADDLNRRIAAPVGAAATAETPAAASTETVETSAADPAQDAPSSVSHPDYGGAALPDYRPSQPQTPNDERR
ncbi:Sec-independent protein translocase protein TatB [Pseudomonas sp. CGJS7]|uniref:Sec-independent protein translocase protein TatB n=1 Tax=Pseudomonas sp. CGJS7 TaxID=3109348 RepID=UPI003008A9F8